MDKKIYLTCEEFCYTLVGDEFVEVAELNSMQEEAHTRILLYASHAANAGYRSVVNVSEDTDVLVLCIAFSSQIASSMYQTTGTQARTKHINISQIANGLGRDICMVLPGMHALTGCDTVSAFAGRGKVSALKVARLHPAYRETLKQSGDSWDSSDALFKSLQGFTCLRADYQAGIWTRCLESCPDIPTPIGYGWCLETADGEFILP